MPLSESSSWQTQTTSIAANNFLKVPTHAIEDLVSIFNGLFFERYNTILVYDKKIVDPIYIPSDKNYPYNRIYFANGFFASALHEIAHWCIAGEKRRRLVDYGYWYEPDGRSQARQKDFEDAEVLPQAVELCFCRAAGFEFNLSVDNISGDAFDPEDFERRVFEKAESIRTKLPPRAKEFAEALGNFY